jgi:hypothetical protein
MRTTLTLLGFLGGVALLSACKAGSSSSVFTGAGGSGGQGGNSSGGSGGNSESGGSTGKGGDDFDFDGGLTSTSSGSGPSSCLSPPGEDGDHDGFTGLEGDCNDCDPNVNPNAIEVIATTGTDGGLPTPVDENCDGMVDNLTPPCDIGLPVDDNDPMSAARAVDICHVASGPKDWGVVSAKWVLADGSPPPSNPAFALGHGILTAFGPNVKVQAGGRMLGLSSGTARQVTDPGYQSVGGFDKGYTSNSPMGFPKESPACPNVTTGAAHDAAGLELVVRAPSNAHGFSFNFNFFTYEWPSYICSQYNDFFVALLSPIPMGQADGNISFDSQGNPVSVNNAFIEVCGCAFSGGPPCQAGGKSFSCALGDTGLVGTGFQDQFQDHGSTGWLFSKAPVDPGQEITMRWAVYDSGDGVLDSSTLIDNWQWIAEPGTQVGTGVVPPPK